MVDLSAAPKTCSVCGEPLGPKGVCFACLLRTGLDGADQPAPAETTTLFDDFEIVRRDDGSFWELGQGAMGVTYRAIDKTLHRAVALKVIKLHGSDGVRQRFLREARAAAALRHPNVATVFRFGALADGDRCYCAMELVEGETLDAMVRREGPLKLETALEIAIQVARALVAAASGSLVHRDLKPGNIMLAPTDGSPGKVDVKVIDFGLAKAAGDVPEEMELTRGEFVGTPAFASPEQFAGGAIDSRTDIYALGVTLWFALTGRLPFAGRTIDEIRQHQAQQNLPLEQLQGVPRRVSELLRSCLAFDPAERPASARVLLETLESCRVRQASGRIRKFAMVGTIAFLALAIAGFIFWQKRQTDLATPLPLPAKSIAVLPFENLSAEPANAYFAEGIQDTILTSLAAVRDLKVISRTSTTQYKSKPDNVKKVAQELGASTILEGSVQKDGDKVRINVQLINAATDSHLWAQTYDRNLTDIFSVESEVARAIADRLQAKLTGEETEALVAKPTENTEAYDAYLRGLAYTLKTAHNTANAVGAQKYLREAVRLDRKFALGWALLSYVEALGFRTAYLQPTVALREEAREAAETALGLQPRLGEAVLAKGFYHYACLRDYESALLYFEEARPLLPNSSRIPELLAYVTRKQGQWDRSESYFNEAERLDPRNVSLLSQHALSYKDRRQFPEAQRKLEQILNITPDDLDTIIEQGTVAQAAGDLPRASTLLATVEPQASNANALETQIYQAIIERRPASAIVRLKEILAQPDPELGYTNGELRFWLGWAQEIDGDHVGARESWEKARDELQPFVAEQPENHVLLGDLALTHACLGDGAAAFRAAEQAMRAVPIEKDAVSGPTPLEFVARVAARLGEVDRSIPVLQKLMTMPYSGALGPGAPLTPALLRLDPMFDPIRGDARFQELCRD
jgi:serine/threonine protein kinase/Tfp pilus assembly protein PilF